MDRILNHTQNGIHNGANGSFFYLKERQGARHPWNSQARTRHKASGAPLQQYTGTGKCPLPNTPWRSLCGPT
eukprot:1160037-Pelagomonas_calceolata.AAC.6